MVFIMICAFYSFPNVEGAMKQLNCPSSVEFAKRLMSEIHVATVPGEAFGVPGYLRLSYALSIERIRAGLDRLRGLSRAEPNRGAGRRDRTPAVTPTTYLGLSSSTRGSRLPLPGQANSSRAASDARCRGAGRSK